MAPARSSHAVSDAAYKQVLHESRSIIDELRLQDALLKEEKAARKKLTQTTFKKRRGKKAAGRPPNALNTEQVPMPALMPAAPIAKGFARLPPEVSHQIYTTTCRILTAYGYRSIKRSRSTCLTRILLLLPWSSLRLAMRCSQPTLATGVYASESNTTWKRT